MSKTFWIDPSLVSNLATFTFSRFVNKQSNVIFQSKSPTQLKVGNDLQWDELYQIGSSESFTSGHLVTASTSKRNIQNGYACTFSGNDLQPATASPDFDGCFGTIDLPSTLKNAIFCNGTAIYADQDAKSGLDHRSYVIEDTYCVSWEDGTSDTSAGVYYKQWTKPWSFKYTTDQTAGYISWGPPTGGGEAQWYWYGATDPGKHDPSKSIPTGVIISSAIEPIGPVMPGVDLTLGWEALDWLSLTGKARYAAKTAAYLEATKPSFLDMNLIYYGASGLEAVANLSSSCNVYDFLDGTGREEKIMIILQSLLRGAAPKYAPSEQKMQFSDDDAGLNLTSSVWSRVCGLSWIFKGANANKAAADGIPVAYSWIQGLIDKKYGADRNVTINYQGPQVSGPGGTASFTITGIRAVDAPGVVSDIKDILANEKARQQAPPNAPKDLPTPDPVSSAGPKEQADNFSGVMIYSAEDEDAAADGIATA